MDAPVTNSILRQAAKEKGDIFYTPLNACRNGHFQKYVSTNQCVSCARIAKVAHRKRHPEHTKNQKKKHHLSNMYGLSQKEYDSLLWNQNFVCAICEQPETVIHHKNNKIRTLAVDHCHLTNKIRGLLCINCNQGLGKFKDNPKILIKAAAYLNDHS